MESPKKLLLFFLLLSTQGNGQSIIDDLVENKFVQTTLSKADQRKELNWFKAAAVPFQGMTIFVISERIDTHWYEANVLAPAFKKVTGINVVHELVGEDNIVKKISTQMDMGLNLYDGFINDSDFIGTHFRNGDVVPISDFMAGEGKDVTNPGLDLQDFIGLKFVTGPDKKIYQLPDQQFANLYWYRADWFERKDLKDKFKKIYGYELNVPLNWKAYEQIAEFFSIHVREIDGKRIYGHMDYWKDDPSIGWRFTDAWLSMAGTGDEGLPNGLPVDEWAAITGPCTKNGQ